MPNLGTESRPLRVGIIGSGPSGFYAADALLKQDCSLSVDMFEKLPTPYGLLRGGIAPDHQKMKSLSSYYEKVATKNEDQFRFFGNVNIGSDISIEALKQFYDVLIFSVGCEVDKELGIPGESLQGCRNATEFVGWYNGHPEFTHLSFQLQGETATVIGLGNVALDVVRILLKPIDDLRQHDIPDYALNALADCKVKTIHLVGRRGPAQSAFTHNELREISELKNCNIHISEEDLTLTEASQAEIDDPHSSKFRKNVEILREIAARKNQDAEKNLYIHYFRSPTAFYGTDRIEGTTFDKTTLSGPAGSQKVKPTGETINLPTGIVFKSIGYRGTAIPGIPFDEKKGIFRNLSGRLMQDDKPIEGLYASGWIKRGASGVIGTNKSCSQETVKGVIEDLPTLSPCPYPETDAILNFLTQNKIDAIGFDDWLAINQEELRIGLLKGKVREKFLSAQSAFSFLRKSREAISQNGH
jgi:ferredoxin--NADP+ reductase